MLWARPAIVTLPAVIVPFGVVSLWLIFAKAADRVSSRRRTSEWTFAKICTKGILPHKLDAVALELFDDTGCWLGAATCSSNFIGGGDYVIMLEHMLLA